MENSRNSDKSIPTVFSPVERLVIDYFSSLEGFDFNFDFPEPLIKHFPSHIIFWLYKEIYYERVSRTTTGQIIHSQYPDIDIIDIDSPRRTLDRSIKRSVTRKIDEATLTGAPTDYYESVGKKSKGVNDIAPAYHLASLDYRAVKEYTPSTRKLSIIDILMNKEILSSKKVSNQAIIDAYREYYSYIQTGANEEEPSRWIENLIDLSSLESQTAPGFFYAVAKYVVTSGQKNISETVCSLHGYMPVCHLTSNGYPFFDGTSYSRFLYDRVNYIGLTFQYQGVSNFYDLIMQLLSLQIRALARRKKDFIIFEEIPELYERLVQISPSDAATYFKHKYNLFETYSFPELADQTSWTNSLLKTYRKVVTTFSQ